ncbi:MAG: hypothetical protein A3F31_04555 [Candidatus Levybacteria bacterium RIFCSPHIGHO2_12_FULL_38_12]|nr:MAG: hypothetical protein A2770_04240 [Candidatus Levybacteria bacterium RIFCSPHIGHO2_01_FULL_38_12]OGH21819.1 MAG: hypothetical protein A3D75_01350 [Candidatus Levybacteria bacterium RIFCSPHIGHO2_02_FULL_37_18]OGH22524.1 MAG: hypothetical protein A3F31_04555 [Candidatus Levybacteria bacterium RIFCSPHIGHO2_12_FULL_38_12]OGH33440.1 MAG: hypothetical protein A3A47_04300 [Candidatus Levybacteria bacterium RIFCSPLOWO2_01_FULL_37_20]OGH44061.1 MAG: hypothetical protein A3J14_04925 [Candidatus Lev
MKLIITAGGGGHFAPALSVYQQLSKDTDILIIGRKYSLEGMKTLSLEYKTAKEYGIKFKPLIAGRLQRTFTRYTFASLLKIPIGLVQSFYMLSTFQPDVVFATGGYVTVPVCIAAFFLRIPIVIHEQTLGIGLSNKIISYVAKAICISFKESEACYPKEKTVLTGNPIRQEIMSPSLSVPDYITKEFLSLSDPVVYITGGSLGSHGINLAVEACLSKLLKKYRIIHQTGDAQKFADFERLEKRKSHRYIPVRFISPNQTGYILKLADLVISRAGMNSISEFIYTKKPALLIPLMSTQKGEQKKNALYFTHAGLGQILSEDNLSEEILYQKVEKMMNKIDEYKNNFKRSNILIRKDAAKKVIDVITSIDKN